MTCSAKLPASRTITKKLLFVGPESSDLVFDCNGATLVTPEFDDNANRLLITTRKTTNARGEPIWQRPENLLIRNCNVHGNVRLQGMSNSGENGDLKLSSYKAGHTQRAQDRAPKNVTLDHFKFVTNGAIPLYILPGITYFTVKNSLFLGESDSVAIYLDAESAFNTIKNNTFDIKASREVIAIDGSARNYILGNLFTEVELGGIFLYRNCGEKGTVRQQPPMHNQIINNIFENSRGNPKDPVIFVSSRDGNRNYCDLDKKPAVGLGSNLDNRDFARQTVIAQNQIVRIDLKKAFKFGKTAAPYHLFQNVSVSEPKAQKSGCFVDGASPSEFLKDGQSTSWMLSKTGHQVCDGFKRSCVDGKVTKTAAACPKPPAPGKTPTPPSPSTPPAASNTSSIECSINSSNEGCTKTFSCPAGKKIESIKAVCDLEAGLLEKNSVANLKAGLLKVVTASDKIKDGSCFIDKIKIQKSEKSLSSLKGQTSVKYGCREKDGNGGDCQIKGEVTCR